METKILDKNNTGIASEFLVAGELARRGYNVALTFGNTKSIDLLIERDGKRIDIQVKGIQRKASICWNIHLAKVKEKEMMYVLVNLNADTLQVPEFFILTQSDVFKYFKPTSSGRDYLDYNMALREGLKDRWYLFD